MSPRLEPLRAALRALPDDALLELLDVVVQAGYLAPSFTAWIKHVAEWELDRRAGMHYCMLFPEELATPAEFARDATRALADVGRAIRGTGDPRIIDRLLDALGGVVRACERYK